MSALEVIEARRGKNRREESKERSSAIAIKYSRRQESGRYQVKVDPERRKRYDNKPFSSVEDY